MHEFAAWGKLSVSIVKYDGDKAASWGESVTVTTYHSTRSRNGVSVDPDQFDTDDIAIPRQPSGPNRRRAGRSLRSLRGVAPDVTPVSEQLINGWTAPSSRTAQRCGAAASAAQRDGDVVCRVATVGAPSGRVRADQDRLARRRGDAGPATATHDAQLRVAGRRTCSISSPSSAPTCSACLSVEWWPSNSPMTCRLKSEV